MKKGLKGLLIFMVVMVLALVIALNVNMVGEGVVNELGTNGGNFQNLSNAIGATVLNVTLTGNATYTVNYTNVTFMFSNMSDAYMYNTTINTSNNNQTYFANTSFNTALLADGVYNLSINFTNRSSDSGQNVSQLNFGGYNITIDNTAPTVTQNVSNTVFGLTAVNGSNITASTGNVSINFTIYDSRPASAALGGIQSSLFNISVITLTLDNGTGRDLVFTNLGGNSTSQGNITNISGVWVVNYNLSSLFEGQQGGILFVNDTHNNSRTVVFNFTVDRTAPVTLTLASSSVSSTGAKITLTANESLNNCTYASVGGAQGSAGSGNFSQDTPGTLTSYSKTFSSLTASTGYQIAVTCTDFAGYTLTDSISWSTSAAAVTSSNGGGGSGGSSGGVSSGVQGQLAKEVWTSINAGETASVKVENGAIGVTEVSFGVPATVYGAWVQVAKKDSLPTSVSKFEGKVYRNLEITKGPALNKEGSFTDATVKFKVEKAWLAEKQLTKEAVALHHYENGKWTQLQTQVGEDDGTYVHYSAKTPGFSYFVIGEKSGAAPAPAAEVSAEQPAATEPAAEAAEATAPAMEQKGMSKGLLVGLLVALVVIVAAVLWMRKRK